MLPLLIFADNVFQIVSKSSILKDAFLHLDSAGINMSDSKESFLFVKGNFTQTFQ